jgi:hypothetical protein
MVHENFHRNLKRKIMYHEVHSQCARMAMSPYIYIYMHIILIYTTTSRCKQKKLISWSAEIQRWIDWLIILLGADFLNCFTSGRMPISNDRKSAWTAQSHNCSYIANLRGSCSRVRRIYRTYARVVLRNIPRIADVLSWLLTVSSCSSQATRSQRNCTWTRVWEVVAEDVYIFMYPLIVLAGE